VEIKQGLKEGDKVIGKFDQNLHAGSKASIKNKRFALFMEQPLIVVQILSKSFRRDSLEISVLRNVSLQVARGEFVAFMGLLRFWKNDLSQPHCWIHKPSEGRIVIAESM